MCTTKISMCVDGIEIDDWYWIEMYRCILDTLETIIDT